MSKLGIQLTLLLSKNRIYTCGNGFPHQHFIKQSLGCVVKFYGKPSTLCLIPHIIVCCADLSYFFCPPGSSFFYVFQSELQMSVAMPEYFSLCMSLSRVSKYRAVVFVLFTEDYKYDI